METPARANTGRWLMKHRRLPIAGLHLLLIGLANYIAFWLRFDNWMPRQEFLQTALALLVIRAVMFVPFRLYEGLWRYTSVEDLRNILAGVGLSTGGLALRVRALSGMGVMPRPV